MEVRVLGPYHNVFLIFLMALSGILNCQGGYTFSISTRAEKCAPGSAAIDIAGTTKEDEVRIEWSTGQQNFTSIRDLEAGSYSVLVRITRAHDSIPLVTDTTIVFEVAKELCPVEVPRHFSPNSDGYHDELLLTYIEKYPNFELQIYNKWGQLVHKQKRSYTPWTGDWNGVTLPDGTYFYVLIYDTADRQTLQKGDITILR
jgi:gliding motility-associated-like protein